MSAAAQKLFDGMKGLADWVKQNHENQPSIGAQLWAEGEKKLGQGATEIASVLNNGHGWVPYGPGQQPTKVDQDHGPQLSNSKENEHEHEVGHER